MAATAITYPPSDILNENHEYLILWMLNSNEICTWADFLREPIEIKQATLSNNLQQLISNQYVEKISRGNYQITSKGREYFQELQDTINGIEKEYPPKSVLIERDYADIILWMLFHNDYCTWSDFLADPLSINQSSLSKYLNLLLNQDYIQKVNKKYQISELGKNEYYTLIQKYHLDRQSILNEKIKQIDQETTEVNKFFDNWDILDQKLKYYFSNLKILLDYQKIASVLGDEETFNKILLFLTLNHPDRYPAYIDPKEFSERYHIEQRVLEYYLYEIIHNDLFSTHFFEITTMDDQHYYFHEGEKIEKILAAILEDTITQETFFSQVPYFSSISQPSLINRIIRSTLREITRNIFDEELNEPLRTFLSEYINYRIVKLKDIPLAPTYLEKLDTIAMFQLIKRKDTGQSIQGNTNTFRQKEYRDIVREINRLLEVDDKESASPLIKQLFMKREQFDLISQGYLALWLMFTENFQEALEIFTYLEQEYAESEEKLLNMLNNKAYCYHYMKEHEKALEITKKIVSQKPDDPNFNDSHGEMLAELNYHEEAITFYLKALNSHEWQQFRHHTYIKLAQSYGALKEYKKALEASNEGIISIPIPLRTYQHQDYRKAKEIRQELLSHIIKG